MASMMNMHMLAPSIEKKLHVLKKEMNKATSRSNRTLQTGKTVEFYFTFHRCEVNKYIAISFLVQFYPFSAAQKGCVNTPQLGWRGWRCLIDQSERSR